MKNKVVIHISCEIEWEGDPEYIMDFIDCLDHVVLKAEVPGLDKLESLKAKPQQGKILVIRKDPHQV